MPSETVPPVQPGGCCAFSCAAGAAVEEEVGVSIQDVAVSSRHIAVGRSPVDSSAWVTRHPEDSRSLPVRGCCRDGVCCRDGRCCFCEGRAPTGDECLDWWQPYLPGLVAVGRRPGFPDAPRCVSCGETAFTCVCTTLVFYSCPCFPLAFCIRRLRDTLICSRAIWGPFCNDQRRPADPADLPPADPLCLNFLIELQAVNRQAGWQPRRQRPAEEGPPAGGQGRAGQGGVRGVSTAAPAAATAGPSYFPQGRDAVSPQPAAAAGRRRAALAWAGAAAEAVAASPPVAAVSSPPSTLAMAR